MTSGAAPRYAAVDLGAASGRVAVGTIESDCLSLDVVHRFANVPLRQKDGLHWDLPALLQETRAGLKASGPLAGIGVDAWGCDYGLLDDHGRLMHAPFHYRDTRTLEVDLDQTGVPAAELYARTGIQHLRFNTMFQLLADRKAGVDLERAQRIALICDLVANRLGGSLANERTAATTTGLVDARSQTWALDLIDRLGLPSAPFEHPLVEAGEPLGWAEIDGAPVISAVAGHDTASAFIAAPLTAVGSAVISCGTWSLVGLELLEPLLEADAAAANLSNEAGIDGTTRVLRNVTGLWLLQECRREWQRQGLAFSDEELDRTASGVNDEEVPLFDPDLDLFLEPGDMSPRIAAVCRETGQQPPNSAAEFVRSILLSLACKYRLVLELLEHVSGRSIRLVHLVGGGARNGLLCQLTADITGLPVLAGPAEASAIGNVLVQARSQGAFASLAEMRSCVHRSFPPAVHDPAAERHVYERFLALSGAIESVAVYER